MGDESSTTKNSFKLKNEVSNDFDSRVNSVFSSLQSMENSYKESAKQFDGETERKQRKEEDLLPPTRQPRPRFNNRNPMKRRHGKPDHVLHPERYTKYSLQFDGTSKVADKGMSGDQLNKKIAMDFLATLQQQRKDNTEDAVDSKSSYSSHGDDKDEGVNDNNHVFTYKTPRTDSATATATKTNLFQSSHGAKALVMDTFEFGAKQNTKNNLKRKVGMESDESVRPLPSSHAPVSCDFNDVDEKDDDVASTVTETQLDEQPVQKNVFKSRKKNKCSYRKRIVDDSLLPETIDEEGEK